METIKEMIESGKSPQEILEVVSSKNNTIVSEAVKYPSRDDAEFIAAWHDSINSASLILKMMYGKASDEIKTAFSKAENVNIKFYKVIFGPKSPWTIERKSKNSIVHWDEQKANSLQLTKPHGIK